MHICSQTANIHASKSIESETISQGLLGERVKVLQADDHWSRIELQTDGYKGFIENQHLVDNVTPGTHRIITKMTPLFDRPDIKSPVRQIAPLASELSLKECGSEQFLLTNRNQYVWKQHTLIINNKFNGQLVDTAQALFLGSPYLWGGRSPLGLDCSAVVQLTALLHGWHLPRDSSDQVALFRAARGSKTKGQPINQTAYATSVDYTQRQTDDLLYWPGHVAIVLDKDTIVHATAHSLQCCRESLAQVEARAGKPESIWRLVSK